MTPSRSIEPWYAPRLVARRAVQAVSFLLLATCAAAWALSYVARDEVSRVSRRASAGRYLDTAITVTNNWGKLTVVIERTFAAGFTPDEADLLKRMGAEDAPAVWYHHASRPTGPVWLPLGTAPAHQKWQFRCGRQRAATAHGYYHTYCVESPYWGLSLPVLLLNVLVYRKAVRRLRRLDRVRGRKCVHCGYDLRASRGRCPECGKAILILVEAEGDRTPKAA